MLHSLHQKVRDRADALSASGVDVEAALESREFRAFDTAVVAPTFGFRDAEDYYSQSSCGPFLARIETPTLILHALDDPFMDPGVIPTEALLSPSVTLELKPVVRCHAAGGCLERKADGGSEKNSWQGLHGHDPGEEDCLTAP